MHGTRGNIEYLFADKTRLSFLFLSLFRFSFFYIPFLLSLSSLTFQPLKGVSPLGESLVFRYEGWGEIFKYPLTDKRDKPSQRGLPSGSLKVLTARPAQRQLKSPHSEACPAATQNLLSMNNILNPLTPTCIQLFTEQDK